MSNSKHRMRELALEAGLRHFGRIPAYSEDGKRRLSGQLLGLAQAARSLTKKDLAILEAIHIHGSIARAATALVGPDRPAYRTYIQRRLRFFQGLWADFTKNLARET